MVVFFEAVRRDASLCNGKGSRGAFSLVLHHGGALAATSCLLLHWLGIRVDRLHHWGLAGRSVARAASSASGER